MARRQDQYFGANVQLSDPANEAVPIVPDTPFEACRSVYVGTGGSISMKGTDDTDWRLWKNVQSGTTLPFRVIAVQAAGTTAADMLALY